MTSTQMGGGVKLKVDACGEGGGIKAIMTSTVKSFLVELLHFTKLCTSRFGVRW